MAIKTERFFLVKPINEYGQLRFVAELVKLHEGELFKLDYRHRTPEEKTLADLEVTAYIGRNTSWGDSNESPGEVWGERLSFAPSGIDSADIAQNIARAFARIERGLIKIREAEGYPTDYATLLVRVARVLKVERFALWNSAQAAEISGERYRFAKGGDVQSFVRWVAQDIAGGKRANWIR